MNKKTDQEWEKIKESKNKQIAFFNSVNAAIEIVKTSNKGFQEEEYQREIIKWRDWFYKEWQEWHKKETAPRTITDEERVKAGEEFKKRYEKDSKAEDIDQANKESELATQKEMDLREEGAHCTKCGDPILGDEDSLCGRCAC